MLNLINDRQVYKCQKLPFGLYFDINFKDFCSAKKDWHFMFDIQTANFFGSKKLSSTYEQKMPTREFTVAMVNCDFVLFFFF